MVWLGQEWLGLAWELMKNSRASNMPWGPTGGQTNWDKHAFRLGDQLWSKSSINEHWSVWKPKHTGIWNDWLFPDWWQEVLLKCVLLCVTLATWMHTEVKHSQHTQESDSQMRFFSVAAKSEERERRSPLMLQLRPRCLGKQTRMNISVRRSLWVPMVGAWHTYRHRHTHKYTTHTGCQNSSPPNHRCNNYHISITVQMLPTVMLIDLLYKVYNISINVNNRM